MHSSSGAAGHHHDAHGAHAASSASGVGGGGLGASASATGASITVGLGARKNLQSLLKTRASAPDTSANVSAHSSGIGGFAGGAPGAAGGSDGASGASAADHIELEAFLKDWRHFECKTWHLEPTVRLLSWTGKSIEPYGVDYILNKLGFSHARTTIPKWLQRGCMDPLDKVEALLIVQLMALVKDADRGDAHK